MTQVLSYCCVRGCRSNRQKRPWKWQPSFHTFPSDEIICAKWVKFCDNPYISGKSVKELNSKRLICGLHFSPPDKVTCSGKIRLVSKLVVPVLNPPPPIIKIIKPLTKVAVAGNSQNNVVVVSLEDLESNNTGTEELTIEEDHQPQMQQQMEKNVPEKTPQTIVNITQSVNQNCHTSDKKTRKVCEIPRLFFTNTPAVKHHVVQHVFDETNNTAREESITVETSAAMSDSDDIPDDEIDCGLKALQSKLLLQTTRAAAENTVRKKRSKNIKNDPALVYEELKRQRALNRKLRITCTRLKNRCIIERAARKNYLRHVKKYATKEQYEAFIAQLKKDSRPMCQPRKRKRVPAQPIQKVPSEPHEMQQLSVSSPVTANLGVLQVPNTQGQGQLVRLVVFSGAQQGFAFNFDAMKKAS